MASLHYLLLFINLIYLQLPSSLFGQQTAATKYFLKKANIHVKPFSLENARNGKLDSSNLEVFRDLYASTKYLLTQQYNRDYKLNSKYIVAAGKMQQQISLDAPFPCGLNNTRSQETPSSVHELRPGDIDIIGAMGDSLTAGTAILSTTVTQSFIEFRGVTSLGGGLKDWRTFLTLPNIMKVFNPNLYGYAVANTLGKSRGARFNVAEPNALVQDMPYMAEVLIKRMQSDPNVNMAKHWKMISILIGANDVCNDMCYYDKIEDFLNRHRKNLYKTLTLLRENIPRLMVNIVVVPDVNEILNIAKVANFPAKCFVFYKLYCFCLAGNSTVSKHVPNKREIIQRLQQIDIEIAALPEFQLKEFTVVPRTFAIDKNLTLLDKSRMEIFFKLFAIDCFHFSQYGNAVFTNLFWNDMLQVKVTQTSLLSRPFETFACPSDENPYLSTLQNTRS